jgi:alpha-galactosidase
VDGTSAMCSQSRRPPDCLRRLGEGEGRAVVEYHRAAILTGNPNLSALLRSALTNSFAMSRLSIVGAGSVVFATDLIRNLLFHIAPHEATEIVLHDIDPERLAVASALTQRLVSDSRSRFRTRATLDLAEAVAGADYVAVMILVGGYDAIQRDFAVPATYGVQQTVGDTHGIGGISRFIRTVPTLGKIARAVASGAPNALVLWYSNPLAMNIWALSRLGIKRVVGLCRDVLKTATHVSQYLAIPFREMHYEAAGINHMCWFLRIWNQDGDLYPALRQAMSRSAVFNLDVVRFELMRRFGYFVSESSTHLAEYVPYFLRTEAARAKYNVDVGYYLRRYLEEATLYQTELRPMALGDRGLQFPELRHEIGANIIHAFHTGLPYRFYGNVVNESRIPSLPKACIVEVPCDVQRQAVEGGAPECLPPQLIGLMAPHVTVQQLAVDAAFRGDRDGFCQACLLDPVLSSRLGVDEIVSLFDALCEANGYDIAGLRTALSDSL